MVKKKPNRKIALKLDKATFLKKLDALIDRGEHISNGDYDSWQIECDYLLRTSFEGKPNEYLINFNGLPDYYEVIEDGNVLTPKLSMEYLVSETLAEQLESLKSTRIEVVNLY